MPSPTQAQIPFPIAGGRHRPSHAPSFFRGLEPDKGFRTTRGLGSFKDVVALIDMETLGLTRNPIMMRCLANGPSSCVRDAFRKPTVSYSPGLTR